MFHYPRFNVTGCVTRATLLLRENIAISNEIGETYVRQTSHYLIQIRIKIRIEKKNFFSTIFVTRRLCNIHRVYFFYAQWLSEYENSAITRIVVLYSLFLIEFAKS